LVPPFLRRVGYVGANLLVVPLFLRRGNLCGCLVHTFERPLLFRGIKLQIGEAKFVRVKQS
jgi:hypothetical protein